MSLVWRHAANHKDLRGGLSIDLLDGRVPRLRCLSLQRLLVLVLTLAIGEASRTRLAPGVRAADPTSPWRFRLLCLGKHGGGARPSAQGPAQP